MFRQVGRCTERMCYLAVICLTGVSWCCCSDETVYKGHYRPLCAFFLGLPKKKNEDRKRNRCVLKCTCVCVILRRLETRCLLQPFLYYCLIAAFKAFPHHPSTSPSPTLLLHVLNPLRAPFSCYPLLTFFHRPSP